MNMKSACQALALGTALALAPLLQAGEVGQAVQAADAAVEQAKSDAAAAVEGAGKGSPVSVSLTGDQVVSVNTGNETVDAVANTAVKCGEKTAALKTCDSMGGFKAPICRKAAELKYKNVECPLQ